MDILVLLFFYFILFLFGLAFALLDYRRKGNENAFDE